MYTLISSHCSSVSSNSSSFLYVRSSCVTSPLPIRALTWHVYSSYSSLAFSRGRFEKRMSRTSAFFWDHSEL